MFDGCWHLPYYVTNFYLLGGSLVSPQTLGFRAAPTVDGGTGAPLTQSQEVEARWEFSLVASNLPKTIAPDIRRFLRLVS